MDSDEIVKLEKLRGFHLNFYNFRSFSIYTLGQIFRAHTVIILGLRPLVPLVTLRFLPVFVVQFSSRDYISLSDFYF